MPDNARSRFKVHAVLAFWLVLQTSCGEPSQAKEDATDRRLYVWSLPSAIDVLPFVVVAHGASTFDLIVESPHGSVCRTGVVVIDAGTSGETDAAPSDGGGDYPNCAASVTTKIAGSPSESTFYGRPTAGTMLVVASIVDSDGRPVEQVVHTLSPASADAGVDASTDAPLDAGEADAPVDAM